MPKGRPLQPACRAVAFTVQWPVTVVAAIVQCVMQYRRLAVWCNSVAKQCSAIVSHCSVVQYRRRSVWCNGVAMHCRLVAVPAQ
jgi:hypothetical protein